MHKRILESADMLKHYIVSESYSGYDPYDTLNSFIPFKKLGKWPSAIAIQFQKRNPINIRSLLGIKKGLNPKSMGLLLKAFCLQYALYEKEEDKASADYIFGWLKDNYSKGYSGYCWGYNFDWANPGGYLNAYEPSVVVTAFVVDGILEYYNLTQNEIAKEIIISSSKYIINDLPKLEFREGISIAYTHKSTGACYNASLLGAETLAKIYCLSGNKECLDISSKAVKYVLSKQKADGSWFYSFNPIDGSERKQIDFHQGFILVSLSNFLDFTGQLKTEIESALKKGLRFYQQEQFQESGRSLWRLPKDFPVEIHNQAQGIITFSRLASYNKGYLSFSETIATWTIENMQDKQGFFYYRKFKNYTNKIPYMRWSNAWMYLALSELLRAMEK